MVQLLSFVSRFHLQAYFSFIGNEVYTYTHMNIVQSHIAKFIYSQNAKPSYSE